MIPFLESRLRLQSGPLTADLVRSPAAFGLGQVPSGLRPEALVRTICGFCSTGCGLLAHLRDDQAVNLTPDPDYPVNLGMACPKGWEALTPLEAPDRGVTPLRRDDRSGAFEPVGWTEATREFALRMKDVQTRHGAHSVAFLSSGQISTEEMAFLGALFKFGMGGLHADSNTRQCMATAHVAYKQSFGFDAPPFSYADFEESDVLVFIGANPCIAHPIMWQRVLRNHRKPVVVVLDPRRTETAVAADLHLPLAPKSDLELLYGLARSLLARGAVDRRFIADHTRRFDDFAAFVEPFTEERVCARANIPVGDFRRCVDWIAGGGRVSFWWTMGVNQGHEATRTAQAIINLALMTGNIGRPGTGANSITGQCNAMGSRLFANTSSLLGGRDFQRPDHREEVARILSMPPDAVPSGESLAYDQILEGIDAGKIRGLWVLGTNSMHSWIGNGALAKVLGKLEFLAVQDMYATTETARQADLYLPAAGWGEKEGVFINSERRLGVFRKVRRPPGQALSDFSVFRLVAEAWGCGAMFQEWKSPAAAFQILKRLSAGRPCDFSGIRDYAELEAVGGIQWPWPDAAGRGVPPADPALAENRERRLFSDGRFFTADARAVFHFDAPRPAPDRVSEEYPLVLLTGRGSSAQWHTNTRTGKSAILRKLHPEEAYVEIHPDDAARLGVAPQSKVEVASAGGAMTARAWITPTVRPGEVFIPMHYLGVNRLIRPNFDAHSRQPGYKFCPVKIRPAAPGP